jgi:hypothetical protein
MILQVVDLLLALVLKLLLLLEAFAVTSRHFLLNPTGITPVSTIPAHSAGFARGMNAAKTATAKMTLADPATAVALRFATSEPAAPKGPSAGTVTKSAKMPATKAASESAMGMR